MTEDQLVKTDQLVQRYYDTLRGGTASFDENRLRAILTSDLAFEGPIVGRHIGAEGFIKGVAGFAETRRGLTMLRSFTPETRRPRSTTPRCPAAPSASPSSFRSPTAGSQSLRLLYDAHEYQARGGR